MASTPNQSQTLQTTLCGKHKLDYKDICLYENCQNRWLCHICKVDHADSHLRTVFSLSDIQSGGFLDYIDNIITSKEKMFASKMKDKTKLIQRVNDAFFRLQAEIEKVLVDAKTEIIQTIERLYQDLKVDYSEEYFKVIKESLKSLGADFKHQQTAQFSSTIEYFSDAFSKTVDSIDYGIHLTSNFEDNCLDLQHILNQVKSSCNALLAKTSFESVDEKMKRHSKREIEKIAPQEITAMEHCSNMDYFVTGGCHGLLTVWDDKTFSYVSNLQIHNDAIIAIAYFPATQKIVTASNDNSIVVVTLAANGNIDNYYKQKTGRPIKSLVAIPDENKLATISEQGNKIRIFDVTEKKLESLHSIETDVTPGSRLFYLAEEKMLGLKSEKQVFLYSTNDLVRQYELTAPKPMVSCCYVEETKTIHAILEEENNEYSELIWKKRPDDSYVTHSIQIIPKSQIYGKPLEIVANAFLIVTIFNNAFTVRKAYKDGNAMSFPELVTQSCKNKNELPVYLTQNEAKFMMNNHMRKLKVYNFS